MGIKFTGCDDRAKFAAMKSSMDGVVASFRKEDFPEYPGPKRLSFGSNQQPEVKAFPALKKAERATGQ